MPTLCRALEATIEEKKQAAGIVSGSFRDHSIVRTLVEEQLRVVSILVVRSEAAALRGNPLTNSIFSLVSQTMPLSLTLAVSLLGCWQAREAVSPLDIAQAALNGQLPYLNCEATVQGTVGPFSAVLGRNLFSPAGKLRLMALEQCWPAPWWTCFTAAPFPICPQVSRSFHTILPSDRAGINNKLAMPCHQCWHLAAPLHR